MTQPTDLGNSKIDYLVSTLKSGAGAIPFVGGLISEIISNVIPNQRIERVGRYLILLRDELASLRTENVEKILALEENIALLEEGAIQAARAISEERKEYIAKCVARGMSEDARDKINAKRILDILSEIDDEEIVMLKAFEDNDWDAFGRLRPPPAHFGADEKTVERDALYGAARSKLERLNLLTFHPDINRDTRQPEYDPFGKMRGHHFVAPLGQVVLRAIGLKVRS